MDKREIDRLHGKLDKLDDRLDSVDKTLVRNTVSLEDHIRRTELLEQALKPVQQHITMLQGALKLVILFGIVASVGASLVKIFGN